MSGIYIHIPFCKSRCVYCGFYSTTLRGLAGSYVSALCREAELRRGYLKEPVSTVYLGGGTPSLLPLGELRRLLSYIINVYGIAPDAEVTMECNPDDVTAEFAESLSRLPVNRVSMGAQTFSDSRLRFLRRRHGSADIGAAVRLLRSAGIGNVSVDLMFGFPGETVAEWEDDVLRAVSLGAEHISAYCLTYEEGTPLFRMLQRGLVKEVSEDVSAAMYGRLIDILEAAGYEHYEISNFAKPGFRSRHNSGYWRQTPYLGLGAAAHSYDLGSRQWNVSDVRRYISSVSRGELPSEREELDEPTRYNDLIVTALRTSGGVSLELLESQFGAAVRDYCMAQAGRYVDGGLLALTPDSRLRLTRKGLFVSDMIMADLMKV